MHAQMYVHSSMVNCMLDVRFYVCLALMHICIALVGACYTDADQSLAGPGGDDNGHGGAEWLRSKEHEAMMAQMHCALPVRVWHMLLSCSLASLHTSIGTVHHKPHTSIGTVHHKPHTSIGTVHHKPHTSIGTVHHKPHTSIGTVHHKPHTSIGTVHHKPHTSIGTVHHKQHTSIGTVHHKRHTSIGTVHHKPHTSIGTVRNRRLNNELYLRSRLCRVPEIPDCSRFSATV